MDPQQKACTTSLEYTPREKQIFIITGYSGAGKSSVLRALEDNDFFCVDNLPVELLASFFVSKNEKKRIALGIDVRTDKSIEKLIAELEQLKRLLNCSIKIVFLQSDVQTLVKRFQETRRKHPLAAHISITQAIEQEQQLLHSLKEKADILLSTDTLTIHQLRHFVRTTFNDDVEQKMLVSLMSFGFKYGVPENSNFVYDIRSLPNPYFVPELKPLNGTQKPIQNYLFEQPVVTEYWKKFIDFVQYSIQKSYEEGRFFMNVAIGCTGGRHRSVTFVEKLAQYTMDNVQFVLKHRDMHKDNYKK